MKQTLCQGGSMLFVYCGSIFLQQDFKQANKAKQAAYQKSWTKMDAKTIAIAIHSTHTRLE